MAKGSFVIEWEAREYEHKERSADWFWAMGIITAAIAVAAIIFGNVIFGVLIIVSAFSLALFVNRPPEDIHVEVSEPGIRRGNVLYPFASLTSFSLDLEHPHKKIILRSKKPFMPLVVVPLAENIDYQGLHQYLSGRLTEEYLTLPIVEKALEYLGF